MPAAARLESRAPSGPGTEGPMLYRYRLHTRDGGDAGEAEYAVQINPDEIIWTGDGRKLRVVDVVPTLEEGSLYVGLLMVEPA
jgi:hypothetical protein